MVVLGHLSPMEMMDRPEGTWELALDLQALYPQGQDPIGALKHLAMDQALMVVQEAQVQDHKG